MKQSVGKVHALWYVYFVGVTQIVLTLAFDLAVLYGDVALSFVALWTKKCYFNFLAKVFIFS